jgi:hypothetical protein
MLENNKIKLEKKQELLNQRDKERQKLLEEKRKQKI